MRTDMQKVLEAAQSGFATQEAELQALRNRQVQAVSTRSADGSGDISATVELDRKFRLVFIRCHFSGTAKTAKFVLSIDANAGSAYDTVLFTITQAGPNHDVHLRITGDDLSEPSPWTFQTGDRLRIEWTNPDSGNITWGLEVGLALAS